MKKRKWKNRLDDLVFDLLGCVALVVLFCLLFCPSCRQTGQEAQRLLPEQELYEPMDNPPKIECDSMCDSYYPRDNLFAG